MPISYEIDPEERIVHVIAFGDLTVQEIQDFRLKLQRDPHFSPSYGRLIDARSVARDFTRADIRRLSDVMRVEDQSHGSCRRAVVMEEPAFLRMMEIFQAYTRGQPGEYRVFSSMPAAQRWLSEDA